MKEADVSLTALWLTLGRWLNNMRERPLVRDVCAGPLVTVEERQLILGLLMEHLVGEGDWRDRLEQVTDETRLTILLEETGIEGASVRQRYFEDHAVLACRDRGAQHCLVLGAGLDSFGLRAQLLGVPDSVTVTEVDHPAMQTSKQWRLREQGISIPPTLHFMPVDFAQRSLAQALAASHIPAGSHAAVGMLGVVSYLTEDDALSTFHALAAHFGEVELVLSYVMDRRWDGIVANYRARVLPAMGESLVSLYKRERIEAALQDAGFRIMDHRSFPEIYRDYADQASPVRVRNGSAIVRCRLKGR